MNDNTNSQGGNFVRTSVIRQTQVGEQNFDFSSLKDFIDKMKKGEEEVARLRHELDEKYAEDLQKQNVADVKELAEYKNTLARLGITLNQKQEMEFLEDYANMKKKYQDDLLKDEKKRMEENLLNYYKSQTGRTANQEKFDEKQKQKDIKHYKKIADLRNTEGKSDDQIKKDNKTANKEERRQATIESFRDMFKDYLAEVREGKPSDVWREDLKETIKGVGKAVMEGLNQINTAVSTYAGYQANINARLQGIGDFNDSVKTLNAVAYSPLIRTETLYENLSELIGEGIASNVEQKAFLQTVKEGIATTFDVNQGALKRLIKLQQYDTTASRLGMEAYLTRFLNGFVQNTEYLSTSFDSISDSLVEASSLMSVNNSTEFEYQVQKWLGVLSGLGVGDNTITSLGQAIGQLGSGNVSALSSSGLQQLLVMASNKAGLDYGTLLSGGFSGSSVDNLMAGIVLTLQELGQGNSNVVKSSLANAFGVNVSDLVGASNLSLADVQTLIDNTLTYEGTYTELSNQMGELSGRIGISNILENLFANSTFSTGMNIANNPVLYAMWKITDMIQSVTGGINIPYITAMGTGVDLETTVENLMKLSIVGVSTLDNIGGIISGLSSLGNTNKMLTKLGIGAYSDTNAFSSRGTGLGERTTFQTVSATTMIGNNAGDDYSESTINSANDSAQEELDKKAEEQKDPVVEFLEELEFDNKVNELVKNSNAIVDILTNKTIKTESAVVSSVAGLTS